MNLIAVVETARAAMQNASIRNPHLASSILNVLKEFGYENGVPYNWLDDPRCATWQGALIIHAELRAKKDYKQADEIREVFREGGFHIISLKTGNSICERLT
jgi:cysteinyl-tRNA synthetase